MTFREVLFYIHGVDPDPIGDWHTPSYQTMQDGILAQRPNQFPVEFGGAEWGWEAGGGKGKNQAWLTQSQRMLGSRVMPRLFNQFDPTLNPLRRAVDLSRELFFHGFTDAFYYVSADGQASVRGVVASQLVDYIKQVLGLSDDQVNADTLPPISLTLFGHSAGSLIAFDFCFFLFNKKSHNQFLEADVSDETRNSLKALREMADNGRLRIRRLITFGSPITPMVFRKNSVLEIFFNDGHLDPTDYGLTQNPRVFGPKLSNPRWINIWDKDDAIAFPCEPLFPPSPDKPLRDFYPGVSDLVGSVHNAYWDSPGVHKVIAQNW